MKTEFILIFSVIQLFIFNDYSSVNACVYLNNSQIKMDTSKSDEKSNTENTLLKKNDPPPFISIGANFNFIDMFQINKVYGDFVFFEPKLFNNIGLDIGFYNGRNINTDDNKLNKSSSGAIDFDNPRVTLIGKSLTSFSIDTVGIVANQRFSLEERKTTTDIFKFWADLCYSEFKNLSFILHLESAFINVENIIKYKLDKTDTIAILPISDVYEKFGKNIFLPLTDRGLNQNDKQDYFDTFLGIGILLYGENSESSRYKIKSVLGYEYYSQDWFKEGYSYFTWQIESSFSWLEFGLKFGFNLKGSFNELNPQFMIYLSKEYSFKKLLDFLIKG